MGDDGIKPNNPEENDEDLRGGHFDNEARTGTLHNRKSSENI